MKRACLWLSVALLLQVASLDGFAWLCEAAYGTPRSLAERWELPLTWAGLVLAGPLALLCACGAVFLMLRHARAWLALPCVVLLCTPSLLLAVLATHMLGCSRCWW